MAEIDGTLLSTQHSDIRREAAEHTNEIVRESMKGDYSTLIAVKDGHNSTTSHVEAAADRVIAQGTSNFQATENRAFDTMRDLARLQGTADLNRVATIDAITAAVIGTSKDTQIAVLQNTIDGQKNTQYLGDKISMEGDRTRALINEMKYGDLNRALIERNAEIVEERHHARHWRGYAEQSQFQAVATQLQAFQSQLQETRQGVYNFGTMSGGAGQQTSTSNNVR